MAKNIVRRRNLHDENNDEKSLSSTSCQQISPQSAFNKPVEDATKGHSSSFKLKRRIIKLLKNLAKIYLFLNIAGCFLIYAWPEFMSHMIFQTFSNSNKIVFLYVYSHFYYYSISNSCFSSNE